MFDNHGVLYLCFGSRQYIEEARQSARSVRQHMPQLKIACVTDLNVQADEFDLIIPYPDTVGDRTRFGKADGFYPSRIKKIRGLGLSPFKYTLYLDTDTYCCSSMWELLSALLHSDMVGVHAPVRTRVQWSSEEVILDHLGNQAYIPHINSGVLAYRRDKPVDEFFRVWERIYDTCYKPDRPIGDQGVFQDAVRETGLQCMFFPIEFNHRISCAATVSGKVKLLHGRPDVPFDHLDQLFNFYKGLRTLLASVGVIYMENKQMVLIKKENKIVKQRLSFRDFKQFFIEK